jgi:hypothetical protein
MRVDRPWLAAAVILAILAGIAVGVWLFGRFTA